MWRKRRAVTHFLFLGNLQVYYRLYALDIHRRKKMCSDLYRAEIWIIYLFTPQRDERNFLFDLLVLGFFLLIGFFTIISQILFGSFHVMWPQTPNWCWIVLLPPKDKLLNTFFLFTSYSHQFSTNNHDKISNVKNKVLLIFLFYIKKLWSNSSHNTLRYVMLPWCQIIGCEKCRLSEICCSVDSWTSAHIRGRSWRPQNVLVPLNKNKSWIVSEFSDLT